MALAVGMAEWTPNFLASYEQVDTTPRPPIPPTIKGLPRYSLWSSCSTDAKKASISTCIMSLSINILQKQKQTYLLKVNFICFFLKSRPKQLNLCIYYNSQKNFLGIASSFTNHHEFYISLVNLFLIIFFNIFSLNYCICILL